MNLSKESEQMLIMKLLGLENSENVSSNSLVSHLIGEKVIIRTYSAGVHFGELVAKNGQEVHIKNTKRVYYWDGACSLSQLSKEGSKSAANCKISVMIDENILDQCIEVIKMTEYAYINLNGIPEWKK